MEIGASYPTPNRETAKLTKPVVTFISKWVTGFIQECLGLKSKDEIEDSWEFFENRVVEGLSSEEFMQKGFSFSHEELKKREGYNESFFLHAQGLYGFPENSLSYYIRPDYLETGDTLLTYGETIEGEIIEEGNLSLSTVRMMIINARV